MKEQIVSKMRESCSWQDSLLWFDHIDSTNTRAKELSAQGAPHGTVLIADHQTGGRGRLGRSFHSPAGTGIYMSVILRPHCLPAQLMHLTCAVAVAMCDAVESACGIRPSIKWTNDLVWGKRKLGGILTELGLSATGLVDYAILGVGLNCTQNLSDFPQDIQEIASSLQVVCEKEIDRSRVAAAMVDELYRMDLQLLTGQEDMLRRYRADCVTLGKDISLVRADGIVRHGTAVDVDQTGALIVRFADGTMEAVNSGEVSVRGMYGYL